MNVKAKSRVGVVLTERGPQLEIHGETSFASHVLTPQEVSDVVHALLKGSMQHYVMEHGGRPGFERPITSPKDMYAPISWPMMSVLGTQPGPEGHPVAGLCAAYGQAQVMVGLQRSQLKDLANYLLKMDEALPPSDTFHFGLEEIDPTKSRRS